MTKNRIIIGLISLFACLSLYAALRVFTNYPPSWSKKNIAFRMPEKTDQEGKKLPSFDILLSDSLTYFNTLNAPLNKPVVLFYFGPDCPYCQAEIKEIIKKKELLKEIVFYIFTPSPFAEMKRFYQANNLEKYPNIVVGQDYKSFFGTYFQTQSIPFLAIYGRDKILIQAFIGNVSGEQIKYVAEK